MSQGFYGFPRILDIVRATSFKALGKAGATAGAGLAGGTIAGAPVAPAGPFDVGEMVVGQNGTLWICTTAGTDQTSPGSFTQVGGTTSPLSTKGDVWVYGSADNRLAVGSNNQVLTADSTQSLGLKWAVPAASAGGALSQIAQTVLTGTAANIAFSSIPSTYSSLLVLWKLRGDAGEVDLKVQFNSDTGSNYDYAQWLLGRSSGAAQTNIKIQAAVAASTLSAGRFAAGEFKIIDYAIASHQKQVQGVFSRADDNADGVYPCMHNGYWRNTAAAISTVTLAPLSGNFAAGSVVTLYGVS